MPDLFAADDPTPIHLTGESAHKLTEQMGHAREVSIVRIAAPRLPKRHAPAPSKAAHAADHFESQLLAIVMQPEKQEPGLDRALTVLSRLLSDPARRTTLTHAVWTMCEAVVKEKTDATISRAIEDSLDTPKPNSAAMLGVLETIQGLRKSGGRGLGFHGGGEPVPSERMMVEHSAGLDPLPAADSRRREHNAQPAIEHWRDRENRRWEEMRAEFFAKHRCLSSSDVAEIVRSQARNRGAIAHLMEKQGRIFGLKDGVSSKRYPYFQFKGNQPNPVIAEVLKHLSSVLSAWQIAFWFTSPDTWALNNRMPVDALDDDPGGVIEAARHAAAEIAD
jgi:hypothetical protein